MFVAFFVDIIRSSFASSRIVQIFTVRLQYICQQLYGLRDIIYKILVETYAIY